jgi:hypothetical protein
LSRFRLDFEHCATRKLASKPPTRLLDFGTIDRFVHQAIRVRRRPLSILRSQTPQTPVQVTNFELKDGWMGDTRIDHPAAHSAQQGNR